MAWNANLPADNSKIRNGPSEIRDNWDGIEQALSSFRPYALNLVDRTGEPIAPEDPAAIATTMIPFCKQDSAGDPQLFTIDPSSTIRQLTGNMTDEGSGHYSSTTPMGFIVKWGFITLPNTNTTQTITYPTAFPTACHMVNPIVTALIQTSNPWRLSDTSLGTTNFTIVFNGAPTVATNKVSYIAIGN